MIEQSVEALLNDRTKTHGDRDNLRAISALWNEYLNERLRICQREGVPLEITSFDAAIMMCLFKIGRMIAFLNRLSDVSEDTVMDLIGYAELARKLYAENKAKSI